MLLKMVREGLGRVVILGNFLTQKKPMIRDPKAQQLVNEQTRLLSLYQFYACPFCVKVRRVIHELNVPIELRNAQYPGHYRDELGREGGKVKVPCLRIESGDEVRWLYESDKINQYLRSQFG